MVSGGGGAAKAEMCGDLAQRRGQTSDLLLFLDKSKNLLLSASQLSHTSTNVQHCTICQPECSDAFRRQRVVRRIVPIPPKGSAIAGAPFGEGQSVLAGGARWATFAAGTVFMTRSRTFGASFTSRAARLTGTATTFRTRWAEFVLGEFAVTVFVQLLQRLAGLGDFFGVDDAVVVEIQCDHKRHGRAGATGTAGSTAISIRATGTAMIIFGSTRSTAFTFGAAWTVFTGRGALAFRTGRGILSGEQAGGSPECQG